MRNIKKVALFFGVTLTVATAAFALMNLHATRSPEVEISGLDDVGLKLELPYGLKNLGDFILRNHGRHTVVGYRVIYEGHLKSGRVVEWSAMTIQPLAVPAYVKNRKPEHLSERFGCLPPGSAIFGGLLRDSRPLKGYDIPKLEDLDQIWEPQPTLSDYVRFNVRLDSVMLEDGQVFGPNKASPGGLTPQTFEEQMREFLAEYSFVTKP